MSVIHAERCGCGEQHAVEIPGEAGQRIAYLRPHDLVPIERCQGCGRPFAEMLDELERLGDERWNEEPREEGPAFGCGGIKMGAAS